jgi:hypothetical protein
MSTLPARHSSSLVGVTSQERSLRWSDPKGQASAIPLTIPDAACLARSASELRGVGVASLGSVDRTDRTRDARLSAHPLLVVRSQDQQFDRLGWLAHADHTHWPGVLFRTALTWLRRFSLMDHSGTPGSRKALSPTFQTGPSLESLWYTSPMSASDAIDDLIELRQLAEQEHNAARRRRLFGIHDRVAARTAGVRVSEAAGVLGLSAPTIRAWLDAKVLIAVPGQSPLRVTAASLAAAKRAVDEIRSRRDDRHLLADVARLLRDRAALGPDAHAGIEDMRAGRVTRLDHARLDELLPSTKEANRSSST